MVATPEVNDEELLQRLMDQIWAIYRHGGDFDLGSAVAAQMLAVCERLPAGVAQAALVRNGFIDAGNAAA